MYIEVTVSIQTKLNKSPYYYAVLHWGDPFIIEIINGSRQK